jgi:chromosome segregation ATPase
MSDTPRTDAAQHNMGSVAEPHYVVDVEVAHDLERELVAARAEIVRLTKRKDECSNGWDGALATVQRLERELADAVTKERERCAKVCDEMANSRYQLKESIEILTSAADTIRGGE